MIGAIFYFCAKKIYLRKETSTETNQFAAFDNSHIPTVTIYNHQSYSIPLSRFNTVNYADVPPSYDNSVLPRLVSNECDMPPSYEEALISGKLN